MSQLQYYAYKGQGEAKRIKFSYAQAVRVGNRIECAGQGSALSSFRREYVHHDLLVSRWMGSRDRCHLQRDKRPNRPSICQCRLESKGCGRRGMVASFPCEFVSRAYQQRGFGCDGEKFQEVYAGSSANLDLCWSHETRRR